MTPKSWKSNVNFNLNKKYVEYQGVSSWQVGLVTSKVYISGVDSMVLLDNVSSNTQTMSSGSFSMTAPHYDDPWAFALNYNSDTTYYEYLVLEIGGKSFTLI